MSGRHLASYLFDAASLWGERPACADAARTYSYNDYLNEALRVAALLRRAGVEAGDRVCISAPKSFSLYASMFGALMLQCLLRADRLHGAGRARAQDHRRLRAGRPHHHEAQSGKAARQSIARILSNTFPRIWSSRRSARGVPSPLTD